MRKRDDSLDLLRVSAAFTVVWLHVATNVVLTNPSVGDLRWWAGNIADSFSRWCVPVFVMISGALLLSGSTSRLDLDYYKRRFSKVLFPLFFWTIFYLGWRLLSKGHMNFYDVISCFIFSGSYYHLWYLYMIIGLYFVAPFLQRLISVTSTRDITMLCVALLVSGAVEAAFGTHKSTIFYQFIPFLGFFLAGYCLYNKFFSFKPGLLVFLFFFCGIAVAISTGALLSIEPQPWSYTYANLNPLVIIMSLSLFGLVAGRFEVSPPTGRIIRAIAPLTLGIYLIHPIWLDLLHYFRLDFFFHPVIGIPVTTLIVFLLSAVSAFCFRALPGLRRAVA